MTTLTRAFLVPLLIVLASMLFSVSFLVASADGGGGGGSFGTCGNGVVEMLESCDDGNLTDGDGCSSVCATEGGGSCQSSGQVQAPTQFWDTPPQPDQPTTNAACCGGTAYIGYTSNQNNGVYCGTPPSSGSCNAGGTAVGSMPAGPTYQCTTELDADNSFNCCSGEVVYGGGNGTDRTIYCAPHSCSALCSPNGTVVGQTQMQYQDIVLQDDDRCCSGSSVYGGQYGRDIVCRGVDAPPLPVTASISVTPSTVAPSAPATLTWSSTNAVSCTGTGFSTGGATSGSVAVSETASTTYAVSCYRSDYTSGGSGFTGDEWWTGTQTKVYQEWVHNNGGQGNLCRDAAGGAPWNVEYRDYPHRSGDAGYALLWITCYAVTNPTGTEEKPPSYNQGKCRYATDPACYSLTYFRSDGGGTAPAGSWATASASLTITSMPDLTTASISPASASAGVPTTFTGLVWNQGGAGTGAAFNNIFFLDNDADHATSYYATYPSSRAALGGDMMQVDAVPVTQSITIPSPGTWYLRFCTDMNASWAGTITESNEENNCSDAAWTAVEVTSVTPTAMLSCSPASCTAPVGTPVTLTYACTNSTSATLSTFGSLSPVAGGTRDATVAGGYTLSCSGPGGTANDTESVSFTVPTVNITATPDRVRQGGTTNITWVPSPDVTDCTITRAGAAFATGASGTNVPATNITTQTTFAASCTSGGVPGAASDTVIVNIVPNFEEF